MLHLESPLWQCVWRRVINDHHSEHCRGMYWVLLHICLWFSSQSPPGAVIQPSRLGEAQCSSEDITSEWWSRDSNHVFVCQAVWIWCVIVGTVDVLKRERWVCAGGFHLCIRCIEEFSNWGRGRGRCAPLPSMHRGYGSHPSHLIKNTTWTPVHPPCIISCLLLLDHSDHHPKHCNCKINPLWSPQPFSS